MLERCKSNALLEIRIQTTLSDLSPGPQVSVSTQIGVENDIFKVIEFGAEVHRDSQWHRQRQIVQKLNGEP